MNLSVAGKMLRLWLALIPLCLVAGVRAQTVATRTAFADSIAAVDGSPIPGTALKRATVARTALLATESSATMGVEVALTMRNFAELQARVAQGEVISRQEMAEKYFPTKADHARVVAWLRGQGLAVTRTDDNRLAVFARGKVSDLAQAFQVSFARVTATDGEYTSAITAPSLPADVATAVLGVHGLQPHLPPPRPRSNLHAIQPAATSQSYLPAQIAAAYNATGLGVTGAGQTIAVFALAYPTSADLTAFWKAASVNVTTSNIQQVNVAGGPAAAPSSGVSEEATLDVEWSSALAPGANIRVYGANENDMTTFDEIFQQVYADLPSQPTMHVFSVSYGGNELEIERTYLVIEAQYMANFASAGVSVLVSSGDTGAYANGTLQVGYPASDPDVTGVGGTALQLTTTNAVTSETVWNDSSTSASTGGISAYFPRPSWQVGTGVPSGTTRCVPDVSSAGDPSTGAIIVFSGKQVTIGGTSWSAPTWAAFCALMNQSRAAAGQAALGFLNPKLYPLLGTTAFRDVTSGNNNFYSAGVGYDLCTGLGVPNVAAILAANLTTSVAPMIAIQTGNAFTTIGQPATFYVAAEGAATLTYQWQRKAAGSSSLANLSDSATYVGTGTPMLVVNGTTAAMSGDQFQCVVTNSAGSVTSSPAATLTVSQYGVTTLAGWPGSGGAVNATGMAARFSSPGGLRVDAAGNVYVADSYNDLIRKVTPAGVVTTLAGSARVAGSSDGTGTAATFNGPGGLGVDSAGNVYVADSGNYTIRKITPAGVVTTLAGTAGAEATTDGTGTAARFYDPQNLCVDSTGTIYVADGAGNTIRKVTPAGVVTTIAGASKSGAVDGTGTAARFNYPTGVAVDASFNLYVADYLNNTIRKVTPAGVVTTIAGSSSRSGSTDGAGTTARFSSPAGIAVDTAGNLYVADSGNGTIREVNPAGVVTTLAGSAGVFESINGLAANARFEGPADVALDPTGNLYAADPLDQTIRRIVPVPLPQFGTQPTSVTITAGQNTTFTVSATSQTSVTYQWQVLPSGGSTWTNLSDGGNYSGTATPTLTVLAATVALDGSQYQCVATNAGGSAVSSAASLFVLGVPFVSSTSQAQSAALGSSVTLSVAATGRALTYQWQFNGANIAGATGPTYTIASLTAANAGVYSVIVTNSYGSSSAVIATLTVASARLTNLSSRANVTGGANNLFVGFVIGGTGTKSILVRASGPALAAFGVSGYLTNPSLTLTPTSGTVLGPVTSWPASYSATFTQVGAFAWTPGSADAALIPSGGLPTGAYSATVGSATSNTGVSLAEIYDADVGTPTARLINISSRANVGTGANILAAGFVIGGSGTEKVLIRGIGPALAGFGLTGILAVPQLTLFDVNGKIIATNLNGWSSAPSVSTAASTVAAIVQPATATIMASVGAFALTAGTADTAMVVTLPVGAYTAQVVGASSTTGISLIEVYEVPQ